MDQLRALNLIIFALGWSLATWHTAFEITVRPRLPIIICSMSVNDAVICLNRQGTNHVLNQAAERLYGYTLRRHTDSHF